VGQPDGWNFRMFWLARANSLARRHPSVLKSACGQPFARAAQPVERPPGTPPAQGPQRNRVALMRPMSLAVRVPLALQSPKQGSCAPTLPGVKQSRAPSASANQAIRRPRLGRRMDLLTKSNRDLALVCMIAELRVGDVGLDLYLRISRRRIAGDTEGAGEDRAVGRQGLDRAGHDRAHVTGFLLEKQQLLSRRRALAQTRSDLTRLQRHARLLVL